MYCEALAATWSSALGSRNVSRDGLSVRSLKARSMLQEEREGDLSWGVKIASNMVEARNSR